MHQSLWAESVLSWAAFCLVHKRNSAPGFSSPFLFFRIGTLHCFHLQMAVSTVCLKDLLWKTSLIVWAKPRRHGRRREHKGNNWRHGQDRDRNKAGDGSDTHMSTTNWNTCKCLAAAACWQTNAAVVADILTHIRMGILTAKKQRMRNMPNTTAVTGLKGAWSNSEER